MDNVVPGVHLYRTQSETKLVWWPTPQDYNEAIQIPLVSLSDVELRAGLPYTNALELPRSITGSFASVYRMHCQKKDFALRLFLSNIRDQEQRYSLISDFVQQDDLPHTVTFDFLKEGIKIHGEWHPALKMDWLNGDHLDDYIVDNLDKPEKLGELLDKFVKMMQELRRAGIAHGDLQHGNILVCEEELRLVDYDGMFVPAMKGFSASELGHRNYQHPARAAHHFGPYLDNFSAWIIYASLYALRIDSRLMHQLGGGDDCLLFRQTDFMDPLHSPAFAALEKHADPSLRNLGRFVRAQLKSDVAQIPFLALPLPQVLEQDLHPVSESAPVIKSGARLMRGNLTDWLDDENAKVLSTSKLGQLENAPELQKNSITNAATGSSPKSAPNTVPKSWTVPAKPAQQAVWLKPKPLQAAQPAVKPDPKPAALQLPVELTATSAPRKVRWNKNCGRANPRQSLYMMLLNPIMWAMLYYGLNSFGIDTQLVGQGVFIPATVISVITNTGKNGGTQIDYQYTFGNHTYYGAEQRSRDANTFRQGEKYKLGILPSNPSVTEPLNAELGSKLHSDQMMLLLSALINLITIELIVWSPLKQRKLAVSGKPLIATIDALRGEHGAVVNSGVTSHGSYEADISFAWSGVQKHHTIRLSALDYKYLAVGFREIILYDEKTEEIALYRFCRYHPVAASAPVKTVKP